VAQLRDLQLDPVTGDVMSFRPHDIRHLSHMFLTLDALEIDRSRWRAVFQTLNEAIGPASPDQRREQLDAPPQTDISCDAVLSDDIQLDGRSRVASHTSTRLSVAPASRRFSINPLTADAGRSTTSPAVIWLATSGGRMWMGMRRLYHKGAGDRTIARDDSHQIGHTVTIVQRWADPGKLATLVEKWYKQQQISGGPAASRAIGGATL
jgi:hypothetical protein